MSLSAFEIEKLRTILGYFDNPEKLAESDIILEINNKLDGVTGGYQGKILKTETPTDNGFYSPLDGIIHPNFGNLEFDPSTTIAEGGDKGALVFFIKKDAEYSKISIDLNVIPATEISENNTDLVPSGLLWIEQQRVNAELGEIDPNIIPSETKVLLNKSDLKLTIHPTYTYDEKFGTGSQAMGMSFTAKKDLSFNEIGFFAINNTTNTFPVLAGVRCRLFTGYVSDTNDPDLQNATQIGITNVVNPTDYYKNVYKADNVADLRQQYIDGNEPPLRLDFTTEITIVEGTKFYVLFEIADDGVINETKTSVEKLGSILGSTTIIWEDDNLVYTNEGRHSWALSGGVMNSFGMLGQIPFKIFKNDTFQKYIDSQKQTIPLVNNFQYGDVSHIRKELGRYIEKQLFGTKTTPYNLLLIGNSIMSYQDVNPTDRTVEPLGMYSKDAFGYKAWQYLNPKAMTQENIISSTPRGNMGFIKADHLTLANKVGTFTAIEKYTVTSQAEREYFYTTTLNDYIDFTIPSTALGFTVVTLEGRNTIGGVNLSTDVEIKVDGVIVDNLDTYILLIGETPKYREYQLVNTGSDFTITVTNKVDNKSMCLWGVDYWVALPALRPTNFAIPASTSVNYRANTLLAALEASQPDIVIGEAFTLNDAKFTDTYSKQGHYDVLSKIRTDYPNASILNILTHPVVSGETTITKGVDPDLNNGASKPNYLPMFVDGVKKISAILDIPTINVFQKFIDDNGGSLIDFPASWFSDGVHLSLIGHQKYDKLLQEVLFFEK